MRRYIAVIATLALAFNLAACASALQFAADVTGTKIVPASVQASAYKAADISFTAWESVQDGVQAWLDTIPLCPPTNAQGVLCRSQATTDAVKAIQHKTSMTIETLRPAVTAESDVDLLMSIPAIVDDAKAALADAKKGSSK